MHLVKTLLSLSIIFLSLNSLASPLSGSYTIGPLSGDDFSTLSEAVDSLETLGVSGAVTISISAGTYTEQISIGSISGASAVNTITFKGLGSQTLIKFTPTSSDNTIFSLNGASHLVFDSLKIEALGSYGIGFLLMNGTDSITVRHCIIELPSTSSTNKCTGIANYSTKNATGTSTNRGLLIENNIISGGHEGIRVFGNSTYINSHIIQNNSITGFGSIGIHVSGTVDVDILSNIINSSESTAKAAIRMWPTGHSIKIVSNKVQISSNLNHTRVIEVANAPGGGGNSYSQAVLVANNMVIYDGSYTNNMTGIYTKHVSYMYIFNNTVHMLKGASAKSLWLDALSNTANIQVKNNNLTNDVTNGQCFRKHPSVSASEDYNNFYSTGTLNLNWNNTMYNSLSAYRTATSQGTNSANKNPHYIDSTNLHIDTTNYLFDGLGTPVTQVTADIDGDLRNNSSPDIGADEFNSNVDLALGSITSPENCMRIFSSSAISVWIKNNSNYSITEVPVKYRVNNGSFVSEIYNGTIAQGDSVKYNFTGLFFTSNPGLYTITTIVQMPADTDITNDTSTTQIAVTSVTSTLAPSAGACSSETLNLDAGQNTGASYLWSDGSTGRFINLDTSIAGLGSSQLWVRITDNNNCSVSDTINITFSEAAQIDLGLDTIMCIGNTLLLDAFYTGASYEWQDGSTASNLLVDSADLYKVEVSTGPGCVVSDSVEVTYNKLPLIDLGDLISICDNDSIVLEVSDTFAFYQWNTGSSTHSIIASEAGIYKLQVEDQYKCSAQDSVEVQEIESPQFDLGQDSSICNGESISLDATTPGCTYLWHSGSVAAKFTAQDEGLYYVKVTAGNDCHNSDSFYLSVFDNPMVDLGKDTTFCQGENPVLNIYQDGASYLWKDGSEDEEFIVVSTGVYWVELTDSNGCKDKDTVIFNKLDHKVMNLGTDLSIGVSTLKHTPRTLDAGSDYKSYLWSTGSTNQSIELDSSYSIGQYIIWCQVTSDNGCSNRDSVAVEIYDNASISILNLFDFKVYPNPSQGKVTIDLDRVQGEVEFVIINAHGQELLRNAIMSHNNKVNTVIDISNFAKGSYSLHVYSENGYARKTIVLY
ncbi:MAG: T9SS type A sorting domain-containing protein [Bacteroidia bacterium]